MVSVRRWLVKKMGLAETEDRAKRLSENADLLVQLSRDKDLGYAIRKISENRR